MINLEERPAEAARLDAEIAALDAEIASLDAEIARLDGELLSGHALAHLLDLGVRGADQREDRFIAGVPRVPGSYSGQRQTTGGSACRRGGRGRQSMRWRVADGVQ